MKKILFMALLGIITLNRVYAQTEQEQRIQTSYIMAFNHPATASELSYWKGQGNLSVSQLLAKHKAYIAANPGIFDGILNVSYTDAFGRTITDNEKNYHKQYPRTYVEMMTAHMQYLNQNPSLYDDVIRKSYWSAFRKQPTDAELNYWRGQKKAAYIWIFRAHMAYADTHRNDKASLKNVPTVPVGGSVLTETRLAVNSLVGNDGASLIGNDSGGLVAAGGGNLVGNDGSTLVAAGGGN